jgi:hypothetical protein
LNVSTEIANSPDVITKALGQLPAEFDEHLAVEKALRDWVRKSFLTKYIEEADRRLDRALTAVRAQVRAQKYNPGTTIVDAAQRVYTMLMGYGNVTKKSYEAQMGDVQSILRQFASGGAYAADAAVLGIGTLIDELQTALVVFDQLLRERDEKRLLKPEKTFHEVRRRIESVYHRMEMILNAGAVMNTSSAYATLINHLNPEIERLNAEFHRVRHNIADAQIEPIPPQAYSGLPLTPGPNVFYLTSRGGTIPLTLGKDYNLTFKRNIKPGNATCTIHGKGAYKGRKTITFLIVRDV